MNTFQLAYRNLFRRKQQNLIKILSLGIGLAVTILLLAKIRFEKNYDGFYPESERIYRVMTKVKQNKEPKEYDQVSGAVAPGMKTFVPGVEAATRFTYLSAEHAAFTTDDKRKYNGTFILADEHFFDVLSRPMVAGMAGDVLNRPMYALVSESLARRMGASAVGTKLQLDAYPGKEIVIGGVFKDLPENSTNRYDVIVSMVSIGQFSYDGRDNWVGNDRYIGYVKLHKGVDPHSLAQAIRKMQEKNQPMDEIRKAGVELSYFLTPLTTLHGGLESVKTVTFVLSVIAFALLLTTVLNYLLIMITSLMQRSREVAVNKCYGASHTDIVKLISAETLLHFACAGVLSLMLFLVFRSTVEEIAGASLGGLWSVQTGCWGVLLCAAVFAVSVLVPSSVMYRIAPAAVFRHNSRTKQSWKLVLLFVQFCAAAFLCTLTLSISKQYRFMVHANTGYDYSKLLYVDLSGARGTDKLVLKQKLQQNPAVASVALAFDLPFDYMSGNNVLLPGDNRELFNAADMYFADENYIPLMQIPIVAGSNFSKNHTSHCALISTSFATKMRQLAGWKEVVGKDIMVTEHGLVRIVGVFPDIRTASISNPDFRPQILFHATEDAEILERCLNVAAIKMNQLSPESIRKVNDDLKAVFPDREMSALPYADTIVRNYTSERLFRNTILIGGVITLLIALIGLIGYIKNEIAYRTAEIAVRKINGATLTDILMLFAKNILRIALPALVVGEVLTYAVSEKLMQNFSEKCPLNVWEYAAAGLGLLLIIEVVLVLNCIKTANQNPVESLYKD